MRALAAAQACQDVALQFPREIPSRDAARGALLMRPKRGSPDPHHRWLPHLSFSRVLGLDRLQRMEEAFLAGLFVRADERPERDEENGQTVPCTHVRYPLLASR